MEETNIFVFNSGKIDCLYLRSRQCWLVGKTVMRTHFVLEFISGSSWITAPYCVGEFEDVHKRKVDGNAYLL